MSQPRHVCAGLPCSDATQAESLAGKYGIQGFPTIKVFGANKRSPTDYNGGRDADSIVAAGLKEATSLVRGRSGNKGGSSKGSSGGSGGNRKRAGEPGGGKSVVTLTADNFDSLVLGSDDLWLVEFYAPWCGHCKSLAPEWAAAAEELEGDVKLGAVDATQAEALAGRFGVRGYPTIKVFPAGPKGGDFAAQDYQGGRDSSSITAYALQQLEAGGSGAPVTQLTDQASFEKICNKGKGRRVCVLAFLRDLRDDGAAGRTAYIDMLTEVAKANRRGPFKFLWAAAGDHPGLEETLGVAGNAPAVVGISLGKKRAARHTGPFDASSLRSFMAGLSSGRAVPAKLPKGASFTVNTVPEWDGSEAQVEVEEEFSLDDIIGDDL